MRNSEVIAGRAEFMTSCPGGVSEYEQVVESIKDRLSHFNPQEAQDFCLALSALLKEGHTPVTADDPVFSVVVPVYNEEGNLKVLHRRLSQVLEAERYELIFVDDGSKDSSVPILRELAHSDGRVSVVELARNFGHQTAISAGLDFARGSAIICLDADLQDPPEAIPELIKAWREGNEVVYAIRMKRKEGPLKRFAYAAFYRILRLLSDIEIPLDAGDFCLMDRRVVEVIRGIPERNRFIRGIRSWIGFRQLGIPVERGERETGLPKYTWRTLFSLGLDGLIAFSIKPLRLISVFGVLVSVFSMVLGVLYLVQKLTIGLYPPGFATLVVLLSFFAGVQLVTIGVIGEYVGRIFEQAKGRPLYVVKERLGPLYRSDTFRSGRENQ